jgi:transposase
MDIGECISRFLGIKEVFIEKVDFFDAEFKIVITAQQTSVQNTCCKCENPTKGIHSWQSRQVKAAPLGIYQTVIIKLRYPRSYCEVCCAVRTSRTNWINKRVPSLSCGFSEVAGRWMEETTCEATSRIFKHNSRTLWRLDQWRMRQMLFELKLPDDIDCTYLSADEVHNRNIKIDRPFIGSRKTEQVYVTNLVSYKDAKVLWNAPGRSKASLDECLNKLTVKQKKSCEYFCTDIHRPFMASVKEHLPQAKIAIDRFHVAQLLTDAMDTLRHAEIHKQEKGSQVRSMLNPRSRFILTAKPSDRTEAESQWLNHLRSLNQNIHTGLLLVEYFYEALNSKEVSEFRRHLKSWYQLVRQSRLKQFKHVCDVIRKYRRNIENYIISRLTTAVSEGINNKIKVLKRVGYGYPNTKSFQLKILQRCGYLNHYHINTDQLFYSWY